MISKSTARSNKSFASLYDYLTRDKDSILNCYNLYSSPDNKRELIKEFMKNSEYLSKARGKNYLYHEILALAKNDLPFEKQQKILQDLAQKYLSLRSKNHLAFTALHKDKEHTHIHLMISANELEGNKRIRLSKNEFSTIQKELETYKNTLYPELEMTRHYQRERTAKERLQERIREVFKARSRAEFEALQKKYRLEFKSRGKTMRVISNEKAHRLKTLGVLEEYEKCIKGLHQERSKQRVKEKEVKMRQRKTHHKEWEKEGRER